MAIPDEVSRLDAHTDSGGFGLTLANAERVRARAVVIASGARYRRPGVQDLALFEGASVHYWASPLEAQLCGGQEVALVGAGNSAGQAAVYLADRVAKVLMIVRGDSLGASMSRYLVERIAATPNIEVLYNTSVSGLDGNDGVLQAIRCRSKLSGDERTCPIRHLFLFIGADPNTDWLAGSGIALDDKGFVRTGDNPKARSKPVCPAFSRSATSAPARSSGSPPRWETAPRSSPLCTRFWRKPPARPCHPGSEDLDGGRMRPRRRHPRRDPERARVRGMLEDRLALGASAPVSDLRPCRMLRRLAEPARDAALPRDTASGDRGL